MKKKLKDLGFISILIFIIAVGIYWMIYEFKKDGLDHYINLLGDRLIAMVPKEKDKKVIGVRYEEFKQNVKNKKVAPAQIEEVAADILNMSNREDTISVEEAECVLALAVVNPIELKEGIVIDEEPTPTEIIKIPADDDVEKWDKLNEKLRSVVDFNSNFHQKRKKFSRLKNKRIHFNDDLNIVLDKAMREVFDHEMQEELLNLHREIVIVWSDSIEMELEGELEKLSDELGKIFEKNAMNINRLGEIRGLDLKSIADSVEIITKYISDSLQVNIESIQEEPE